MIYKINLSIIICLIIVNSIISQNIIKYQSDEALFQLFYKINTKYTQSDDFEYPPNKYELTIDIEKIENIEKERPYGYDFESAITLKDYLEKGKIYPIDKSYNTELVKIDNHYGQKFIVISVSDATEITFQYKLIFFNNNFRVIITFLADSFKQKIITKMPNQFNKISPDLYEWVDVNKFAELIKQKKVCSELIEWINSFNDIIKSIKIINPELKKYFLTPTANLRFRETPTSDGKYIRMLTKGEKLELVEKGKAETINGVKGNWVKVKTDKGEVGWCFDGYLEEVK